MREMSCPLKKSWKLRWRRARSVVASMDAGFGLAELSGGLRVRVTLLKPWHIFLMRATGVSRGRARVGRSAEAGKSYIDDRFPQSDTEL